jgi:hypothetical protein
MVSGLAQEWRTLAFSEAVEINPRRQLPSDGAVPFLDMDSLPLNGACRRNERLGQQHRHRVIPRW